MLLQPLFTHMLVAYALAAHFSQGDPGAALVFSAPAFGFTALTWIYIVSWRYPKLAFCRKIIFLLTALLLIIEICLWLAILHPDEYSLGIFLVTPVIGLATVTLFSLVFGAFRRARMKRYGDVRPIDHADIACSAVMAGHFVYIMFFLILLKIAPLFESFRYGGESDALEVVLVNTLIVLLNIFLLIALYITLIQLPYLSIVLFPLFIVLAFGLAIFGALVPPYLEVVAPTCIGVTAGGFATIGARLREAGRSPFAIYREAWATVSPKRP